MSGEKPYGTRVLSPSTRYARATNEDGPGPAASTAGGSQGLARTLVRSAEL